MANQPTTDERSGSPTAAQSSEEKAYRSGFAAVVGRPNVGKSTFLNRVVGQKVAIVTPKPQTTRDRIVGVCTLDDAQVAFVDTPGIHQEMHSLLNEVMVAQAVRALRDADVVLLMVDLQRQCARDPARIDPRDLYIVSLVAEAGRPALLLLNKVDAVRKQQVLPAIDAWRRVHEFEEIFPISALQGLGIHEVVRATAERLPEGPQYYPEDVVTDRPLRFVAAEILREKLFERLGQELPYQIAVEVEDWKEHGGRVDIAAVIHVARPSQKAIVIGRGGSVLKDVGTAARKELEALLGQRVVLRTWVKVSRDWVDRERVLRRLGYRPDA